MKSLITSIEVLNFGIRIANCWWCCLIFVSFDCILCVILLITRILECYFVRIVHVPGGLVVRELLYNLISLFPPSNLALIKIFAGDKIPFLLAVSDMFMITRLQL